MVGGEGVADPAAVGVGLAEGDDFGWDGGLGGLGAIGCGGSGGGSFAACEEDFAADFGPWAVAGVVDGSGEFDVALPDAVEESAAGVPCGVDAVAEVEDEHADAVVEGAAVSADGGLGGGEERQEQGGQGEEAEGKRWGGHGVFSTRERKM